MIGEKYINPDVYDKGALGDDNESMYLGFNEDTIRWANPSLIPRQDRSGFSVIDAYGSAHPSGFHVVYCDGSARAISYSIDIEMHRRLAHREDGLVVDAAGL